MKRRDPWRRANAPPKAVADPEQAVKTGWWSVILASATTVIVALLCLSISRFGMNKTTGYALAIGVGVTLLAGLTLVPALMSLFGKYLFWPAKTFAPKKPGRFGWHAIGNWVSQHRTHYRDSGDSLRGITASDALRGHDKSIAPKGTIGTRF